jgi:ATP-dependent 26S proteasome regulatory subunit
MNSQQATDTLRMAIRARTPVIAIESPEEQRILSLIQEMASEPTVSLTGETLVGERTVYRWTHTEGIVQVSKSNGDEPKWTPPEMTDEPVVAILEYIDYVRGDGSKAEMQERASLMVMCDMHRFLDGPDAGGFANPLTLRALRDLNVSLAPTASAVILLSPRFSTLGDADRDVLRITWPLPTVSELTCMVNKVAKKMEMRGIPVLMDDPEREQLARAMAGLTETEARRALSLAIIESKELSLTKCGPRIVSHKAEILESQQGVQLIEPSETLDDIGGLDLLKAEMRQLPKLLTQEAKAAKVRAPRGFLFAGPPGTGKSLSAKVVAGGVMPILRWEPQGSKSKWVGESSANTTAVLRAADAINECVLWIDEADTGLKDSNVEGDSGVSDDMMGLVLTWMQERESDVVVVMTSNHPEKLRHALMERLDRKFFVDYPGVDACRQILRIHLRKRDLSLDDTEIETLAALAAGKQLAGRNIEQAIEAAHRIAFLDDRALTVNDVAYQLVETKGLVEQRPTEAEAIRKWCRMHCLAASTPEVAEPTEETDEFGLEL